MGLDLQNLGPGVHRFLAERHLATLTTHRPDGTAHVVPVGFTWQNDGPHGPTVRVITSATSVKVSNLSTTDRAVVRQVDGGRWLSLEGPTRVTSDPDEVADAVHRYAERYQEPRNNPARVALIMTVDRIMGRAPDA